jgi:hypothetical protein
VEGTLKDDVPVLGLCADCRYRRTVKSARGSSFVLCDKSREDPAFPRYPRLPVVRCAGFARPQGHQR